mmetsp:Transcript_5693/g.8237  ORF Transcript_5693/g.8237 Transcript_5693/m.8237 type:complete len:116 (+) Transcript_5693:176-523(+)
MLNGMKTHDIQHQYIIQSHSKTQTKLFTKEINFELSSGISLERASYKHILERAAGYIFNIVLSTAFSETSSFPSMVFDMQLTLFVQRATKKRAQEFLICQNETSNIENKHDPVVP